MSIRATTDTQWAALIAAACKLSKVASAIQTIASRATNSITLRLCAPASLATNVCMSARRATLSLAITSAGRTALSRVARVRPTPARTELRFRTHPQHARLGLDTIAPSRAIAATLLQEHTRVVLMEFCGAVSACPVAARKASPSTNHQRVAPAQPVTTVSTRAILATQLVNRTSVAQTIGSGVVPAFRRDASRACGYLTRLLSATGPPVMCVSTRATLDTHRWAYIRARHHSSLPAVDASKFSMHQHPSHRPLQLRG